MDEQEYLFIGYAVERNAREVLIDMTDLYAKWPMGQPQLMVNRPGEKAPYPAVISWGSGMLSWNVSDAVCETWSTDDLTAGANKTFEWNKYLMLAFATGDYSNIRSSCVIPASEFAQTNSTHRPVLGWASSNVQVYKVDENTIYAIGTSLQSNQRLRVWGLMERE